MNWKTGLLASLTFLVLLVGIADACPNCKSSIASGSAGLAVGYAWSIGVLLAAPATILAGWVVALVRHARRA